MNKILLGQTLEFGDAKGHVPVRIDTPTLIDSRMLIQGNSRSGKSYLARVLCERAETVPVIILDIEGEFASLRQKIDAVLIGPEGDIPTDLRSAAILARKIAELRVSAIIDIYELKSHDRREYVRRFLDELMALPKELWGPMLVVIDEAHKLCPEKGQGESVATQPIIDLMSQGGKRQFCGVLITQRFSKLHNDAIAEANNVFIGRTWMDADQLRAGKYLGLSTTERLELRNIPQGEFYAFGPALSPTGIIRFKGDKAETRPPKPGEHSKLTAPKPSAAIKEILGQIDDLPAAAEQEARDIAEVKAAAARRETELKSTIHALETELKNKELPAVQTETKFIFPEEAVTALQDKVDTFYGEFSRAMAVASEAAQTIEAGVLSLREAIPSTNATIPTTVTAGPITAAPDVVAKEPLRPSPVAPRPPVDVPEGDFKIKPKQQEILDAIAWYESIGNLAPTGVQVGAVALIDATGGHFKNVVGPLVSQGLIVRANGTITLTDAGRALARVGEAPKSLADYHEVLRQHAIWQNPGGRTIDVLDALIAAGGEPVSNASIGGTVGIDHTGGHFKNVVGPLTTAGLIRRSDGMIYPTEVLFPKGVS